MKGIIFSTQEEAGQLRDIIAKALGYPQRGVNIGGGIHASIEESVTLYYVDTIQNPVDQAQWCIPVDETVENILNEQVQTARLNQDELKFLTTSLNLVQELSSDWFPPPTFT